MLKESFVVVSVTHPSSFPILKATSLILCSNSGSNSTNMLLVCKKTTSQDSLSGLRFSTPAPLVLARCDASLISLICCKDKNFSFLTTFVVRAAATSIVPDVCSGFKHCCCHENAVRYFLVTSLRRQTTTASLTFLALLLSLNSYSVNTSTLEKGSESSLIAGCRRSVDSDSRWIKTPAESFVVNFVSNSFHRVSSGSLCDNER
mmetsp:Transcript_17641/g.23107  ORF Transcript_17641/g.23107 Transcript_17641/m.23107 type:complete len:204 (-) Transcript_17641:35-646(-)